ncbi:MAG TPA: hypothetical protein VK616_06855 [Flavitalea sp.]|nr:hypothetical protein [Flavitalea sp.]
MIKRTLSVVVFVSMVSCTNESSAKKSEDVKSTVAESVAPATGAISPANKTGKMCYANFDNNDTIIISFARTDNIIKGELLYQFDEKDRNMGEIKGVMKGDTIIADYTFISEGINSVRQVVFLKHGDEMVEGFGSVSDDRGRVVYQDLSKLTFDKSVTLKSINCESLPAIK